MLEHGSELQKPSCMPSDAWKREAPSICNMQGETTQVVVVARRKCVLCTRRLRGHIHTR